MKLIELDPLETEVHNNKFLRQCNIERIDGVTKVDQKKLWFKFQSSIKSPDYNDCDSYLLAILMDAMKEGRNIDVKGSVSKSLLSNIVEYQAAWNKWLPDIYNIIDINVDLVRENVKAVSGAICAFSGGVDAAFSVWQHSQQKCSYRTQKINFGSIVHGSDIPITDINAFENTKNKATETLNDIGIKLVPISSNYRVISTANWAHTFLCGLVATLSNFKCVAGTCIFGSDEPYNTIVIPWGSNHITNHLLSSDEFNLIHDGASHSRSEKVNIISEWKMCITNLRVCREGDLKDRNCGKCEKCLRTKLNFLVTGNQIPDCFPDSNNNINFKHIIFGSDIVLADWKQILDYAKKTHFDATWVLSLARIIRIRSMSDTFLPKGSHRREIIKILTKKIRKKIF